MRRDWTPEDLIASWTLVEADWSLVANKTGATRLGLAVLLKFVELEGHFPPHLRELPRQAVAYIAQQVKVGAAEIMDRHLDLELAPAAGLPGPPMAAGSVAE